MAVAGQGERQDCCAVPRLTIRAAHAYMSGTGRMAEWLCRGLQILVQRFDSASGLQGATHLITTDFQKSCEAGRGAENQSRRAR